MQMQIKRIILIRHAESEANSNPLIYSEKPDHLHVLTPKGEQQAASTGDRLSFLLGSESYGVFVSPYERAMRTMQIAVSRLQIPPLFVNQDPRLREQDYGSIQTAEENRRNRNDRAQYGKFFYRFPGGESGADVFDRMSAFLETLHRRFQDDKCPANILLFTHGTAMKCFIMRWYHWTVDAFEKIIDQPENCHIAMMTKADCPEGYLLSEPFEKTLRPEVQT